MFVFVTPCLNTVIYFIYVLLMEIPSVVQSRHLQSWFVIQACMKHYMLNKVSTQFLLNFGYSPKRFDVISNHQSVNWHMYRNTLYELKKKHKFITLQHVRNVIGVTTPLQKHLDEKNRVMLFQPEPHHVRPRWLDEEYAHGFAKFTNSSSDTHNFSIMTDSSKKKLTNFIFLQAPFSMTSYAHQNPHFSRPTHEACVRVWHECFSPL